MGPYWNGMGWGWMALGWVMMLILWGTALAAVVALVRLASGRALFAQLGQPEPPIAILRRRYAAGELTREQFERMKSDVA